MHHCLVCMVLWNSKINWKSSNISSEELQRVTPGVKEQRNWSWNQKCQTKWRGAVFCRLLNFHITPVHSIKALTQCPCHDPTTGWSASQLSSKQLSTVVVTLALKGTAEFGADRQAEAFSVSVPEGRKVGRNARTTADLHGGLQLSITVDLSV